MVAGRVVMPACCFYAFLLCAFSIAFATAFAARRGHGAGIIDVLKIDALK